jgi:hypothetical protein
MPSQKLVSLLGAAAMLAGVAATGLPAVAQAAGRPDFATQVLQFTSPKRGQTFEVSALYATVNDTPGAAVVSVLFPDAFGKPTIANSGGFTCETRHSDGFMAGWLVTCAKQDVANDGIRFRVTAPQQPGEYGVLSTIKPGQGSDADDSDNSVLATVTVR